MSHLRARPASSWIPILCGNSENYCHFISFLTVLICLSVSILSPPFFPPRSLFLSCCIFTSPPFALSFPPPRRSSVAASQKSANEPKINSDTFYINNRLNMNEIVGMNHVGCRGNVLNGAYSSNNFADKWNHAEPEELNSGRRPKSGAERKVISHMHASSDWGRGYLRLSCCCLHWAAALWSLRALLPPHPPACFLQAVPISIPQNTVWQIIYLLQNIHAQSLDAKLMLSDIDARILYLCSINILN